MVALAYRPDPDRDLGHQVLWRIGTDPSAAVRVSDLLPGYEFAHVQELIEFDKKFYAFVVGKWDESGTGQSTGRPGLLVSPDGLEWSLTEIEATAVGTVVRVGRTPDSPPYPDSAAVMDAVVYGGTLYATGWDMVDGRLAIIIWTSSDGERWSARHVPHGSFEREYGGRIVVGQVGIILRLGGPIHTGVGTLISVLPDRFTSVEDALGLDQSYVSDAAAGQFGFAVLEQDFTLSADSLVVSTTSDGSTWSRAQLPATGSDAGQRNHRLVNATSNPLIYVESYEEAATNIVVWSLTDDEWIQFEAAGERVINDNGRIVTWESGILRSYTLP